MTLPVENLLPLVPKIRARDFVELGKQSEELGYSGVWVPETTGPDGISILAALATLTEQIRLGSGILPIFMRSPEAMAQTMASLDSLSGGRFILGLGTSSRAVVESWHGMPFSALLTAMREYCTIVRQALSGERTNFQGKVFSSRSFRLSCPPPDLGPPIFVGALNPPMARIAGEIAGGVILHPVVPDRVKMLLGQLDAGGSKANRFIRPIVASVVWRLWMKIPQSCAVGSEAISPAICSPCSHTGEGFVIMALPLLFSSSTKPAHAEIVTTPETHFPMSCWSKRLCLALWTESSVASPVSWMQALIGSSLCP